jgi:hypothetical protein
MKSLPRSGDLNLGRPFKAGTTVKMTYRRVATVEVDPTSHSIVATRRDKMMNAMAPALKGRARFNGR